MSATVEAIYIAKAATRALSAMTSVRAIASEGLEGDRYAAFAGTFSKPREELDAGRNLTLIEAEAIDAVLAEHAIDLRDGTHRRNLVTGGLAMNDLPTNAYLVMGDEGVVLRVDRTCPPCGHLERLVPGTMVALKHRGGLRTTIVRGGTIRVGNAIAVRERRDVAHLLGDFTHVP